MKRVLLGSAAILMAALQLAGCGGSNSASDQEKEGVPVEVAPARLGRLARTLSFTGDIKAEFEVKVFSKVPDRIEWFFVDEGDTVAKGDPIARIEATTIEQAVKQAEAALAAARAQKANLQLEYDRARRLFNENAMSKQQYDAIQTQYEAAKAQAEQAEAGLNSAKSRLDDATVTAPIGGIIGERNYEVGDMASGVLPLVTIVQMNRVKVVFNATESDLGALALGQKAEVRVRSYPDRSFSGRVTKISPVLDPDTRMAKVEVLVDNPRHELKPGMYAELEVTVGVLNNVIVIPRRVAVEHTKVAKVDGNDTVVRKYYVFVVNGDKSEQRELAAAYVNHESIAVRSGLEVGELVVVAGQNNLRDGTRVRIVNEESGTS